ncbi:MAG: L,D-transpeptidase family protein, partial [Magnetococcales bacterium]|nr:L,D-transpeptidase family protein [Magnetococcales bacterium]
EIAPPPPQAEPFPAPAPEVGQQDPQWVVGPAFLNVRDAPSLKAPVRFFLTQGQVVTSNLSQTDDRYQWRRIQLDNASYWVAERTVGPGPVYLHPLPVGDSPQSVEIPADYRGPLIRVFKSERRLHLLAGTPDKWYPLEKMYIHLGTVPEGPKQQRGDLRTPEGLYYVTHVNPASRYGRDPETGGPLMSFALSYPNTVDAWRGYRDGIIGPEVYHRILNQVANKELPPQNTPLGGAIMIHGSERHRGNWTEGCIALSDNDLKTLAKYVTRGTWVEIRP